MAEKGKDDQIVGWDFEWNLKHSNSERFVDSLLSQIKRSMYKDGKGKKDIVLLFHDYLFRSEKSFANLNYFIETLRREKNIEFRWAEELLSRTGNSE
jgi:hypothetical protein